MRNFAGKSNPEKKVWGVLGKQETFYSPEQFQDKGRIIPLNANPLEAWDTTRSRYIRRPQMPPMPNDGQQGGVVSTSVAPTPTPTGTPTNTPTPSETSGICSRYYLGAGGSGSNFNWIDCDGTPSTTYLPNSDDTEVCGKQNTFTYDGAGIVLDLGPCVTPTPTPTPTGTPTPTPTPTSVVATLWNTNTTEWNNENRLWNTI
jgi:hypothetical protein